MPSTSHTPLRECGGKGFGSPERTFAIGHLVDQTSSEASPGRVRPLPLESRHPAWISDSGNTIVWQDLEPLREFFGVGNAFDPYREALVVERHTIWPPECEDWSDADRSHVEERLHAAPSEAAELDYIRQHTGFARVITVTSVDLDRVSAS
jgi:hypothetical protein